MADAEVLARKSDLGVRTLSAIVMIVVAGGALWLGGWVWAVFVALVAMGVLWEWRGLVRRFPVGVVARATWNLGGFIYVGLGSAFLLMLRNEFFGIAPVMILVSLVIATDVGAYAAGRTIGGPRIAPKISPSKTWAGLGGGIVGATIVYIVMGNLVFAPVGVEGSFVAPPIWQTILLSLLAGAVTATVAQAGDFFESWMKRRAGVKDSGKLIPGHGGLFDRVDGLLAVCAVYAFMAIPYMMILS